MAYHHYDRLSALDASFLGIEDADIHMHVASVGVFAAGPLLTAEGTFDIERVRRAMQTAIQDTPRFRQRLEWIPLFGHPVWVDDERFNLAYHVRHAALPRPGDDRQLKRLAGRILSQQLDRGRPLWEMWFVEGLEEDRFAIITKVHHCLIDGVSGVDLLGMILRTTPDPTIEPPRRWLPRPAPDVRRLFTDELVRRASLPFAALRAGRDALADPGRALRAAREAAEGIVESLAPTLRPTTPTPINADIGPYRRFDWARFELDAVKEVKNRLGGTVNDVVVATVAGALRQFLRRRGERVEDLYVRAMLPVSTRSADERGRLGNRVSFMMAPLPLAEADPRRRLLRVAETTARLKRSKQMHGFNLIGALSDWTLPSLTTAFARLGGRGRVYNLVVTNIPGPQLPIYMLGARMHTIYPLVPLYTNQAVGIALFSYDGGLHWGFNADWEAVPDLHDLVEDAQSEFELLRKASAERPLAGSRGRREATRDGEDGAG